MENSSINFLFRFRDLVAPTIEEHRKVIEKKGSCWWGWWKRPTEDARQEIWADLKSQISANGKVRVGLFDSGTGKVFSASVIDAKESAENAENLPIPEGDRELVPEYYRKNSVSRAWMKFDEIGDPIQFFDSYSLDETPRLLHYSQEVLSRLKGKVIKNDTELRGMDTTIWKVRPTREGDNNQEILLTTQTLNSPVLFEPVEIKSNRILHLTDLHFALDKHRKQHVWRLESDTSGTDTLADAINSALNGKKIGLIIISGDITFIGDAKEFEEAASCLRKLSGLFDINQNNIVIVPGNHDIQWTREDEYSPQAEVTIASDEAQKNYKEFYKKFFLHDPNDTLSMGRRFPLPCGIVLEIGALNSSSLDTGKNFLAGMGRIQERGFNEISNKLGWKNAPKSLALRMLILHHHLTFIEDREPEAGFSHGFGIAVDAPRILRLAAQHGVQLALHGHKHRAFVWRSGVYELPEYNKPELRLGNISIVGGGSAGSSEVESNKNYFNLIEIDNGGVKLEMYQATHTGSFSVFCTWKAALEMSEGKLTLGDWVKP